jgi:hypothetical protein
MGPKLSAILAAVLTLTTVRMFQAGHYLWGAIGVCVVAAAALRAYTLWGREHAQT